MFTTMHRPAYRDDGPAGLAPVHQSTALHTTTSSPYRPTFSSPLSSSPIRASTTTPPATPPSPVSPCSSPIFGSISTNYNNNNNDAPSGDAMSSPAHGAKPNIFKFANRGPARPNPLTAQKREAAQESRRKLFLKNVRQRAEDRRWERRGGEQELLKLEWSSLNKDIQQARNADLDGVVFESDIEDAARLREEVMRKPPTRALLEAIPEEAGIFDANADAMMVDMFEQEQEAELQALVSSMGAPSSSASAAPGPRPPVSPHWSDDDEYDELFVDFLSREQQGWHQAPESGDMDLS